MKLTIDFETRSAVDLKKAGPWAYAEHWSTEVLCLALKPNGAGPLMWIPDKFRGRVSSSRLPLVEDETVWRLIDEAAVVEAHNSGFERAIWYWVLHQRENWPLVDASKWRCSAAKAAYHALPRQLGKAGEALGLDVAKDSDGHRLMLQMCKPRRARKQERADLEAKGLVELQDGSWQAPGSDSRFYLWYEDADRTERLCRYCLQDVEAEHALSETLRDLPAGELRVWQLDQRVNARGIYCDVDGVQAMIDMVAEHRARLEAELKELTGGKVASSQAVAALKGWLSDQHRVTLPDLQRGTVEGALAEQGMDPAAKRALEIRLSLSRSSVAKYEAMMARASHDRRIRDTLLYHGASTGRWSGMGIQPQNMPRGSFGDVDPAVEAVRRRDIDFVEMLWGDPMDVASTCTRSMLCSAPGHDLLCADFSAIEARGVAWLAGEEKILQAFRDGLDVYKVAAQPIYGKRYEEITKDERQIGKVVVLACGYQGKIGAFQSMARVYGVEVSDDQAAQIVDTWRDDNPRIVKLWYGLEEAAFKAVRHPGAIYDFQGLRLVRLEEPGKGFLHLRLPSGRVLHYYDPKIGKQKTSWGEKDSITYRGVDSQRGYQWARLHTYGGKLTENVVQALCRDIMAEAQLRLEDAGYRTVLTVHDEALAEVPKGKGSLEEFEKIMSEQPPWASGMPIKAEGWRGERYRK